MISFAGLGKIRWVACFIAPMLLLAATPASAQTRHELSEIAKDIAVVLNGEAKRLDEPLRVTFRPAYTTPIMGKRIFCSGLSDYLRRTLQKLVSDEQRLWELDFETVTSHERKLSPPDVTMEWTWDRENERLLVNVHILLANDRSNYTEFALDTRALGRDQRSCLFEFHRDERWVVARDDGALRDEPIVGSDVTARLEKGQWYWVLGQIETDFGSESDWQVVQWTEPGDTRILFVSGDVLFPPATLTIWTEPRDAKILVNGAPYREGMNLELGEHAVTVEARNSEEFEVFRGQLRVDGQANYKISLCRRVVRPPPPCPDRETVIREEGAMEQDVTPWVTGRRALASSYTRSEIDAYEDNRMHLPRVQGLTKLRVCRYLAEKLLQDWGIGSFYEWDVQPALENRCGATGGSYLEGSYRFDGEPFREEKLDLGSVACECDDPFESVDHGCGLMLRWVCISERVARAPGDCDDNLQISVECPSKTVERLSD